MSKYLDDVPEEKAFVLYGKKIRNLYALLFEFRNLDDEAFSHFVGKSHNYFSDWVDHVIGDTELAEELRKTTNRKEAIDVLEKHIEHLNGTDKVELQNEVAAKVRQHVVENKEQENNEKETSAEVKQDESEKQEPKKEQTNQEPREDTTEHKKYVIDSGNDVMLKDIAKDEKEIKDFLWRHYKWDMAKEFMYGMAIGILIGLVLSKLFMLT